MSYADFLALSRPPAPLRIAYGSDPLQHVEVWKPRGTGAFPVILLIHGGCWQSAVAKAEIMHRMANALVERGVAVWNVEYRGIDVAGGGYPGTFHDLAAAADLLLLRGAELDLDVARIVAAGHSAGGHLALWLAARHRIGHDSVLKGDRLIRFLGVVSQGGLPDLGVVRTEAAKACGADTIERLVGQPTSARPDPFVDTSPVALAPLGISQVMISGGLDEIAPPSFAESYASKVGASGDDVSVVTIPVQGHFELITPGTPAGEAAMDAMIALLDKCTERTAGAESSQ